MAGIQRLTMDDARDDPAGGWCLVVPVKRLEIAKTRLAADLGARRTAFALAFAADTISAARRTPGVAEVIVVTDDQTVAQTARLLGAHVVPDRPDAGLNPALRWGARVAAQRRPGAPVGALSADLPALRPPELAAVLRFAAAAGPPDRPTVVADAHGRGTTAYLSTAAAAFDPAYGAHSLNTHLQAGARAFVEADVPSLRRDVDTIADLRAALDLGVGNHTAALVGGFTERQIGA